MDWQASNARLHFSTVADAAVGGDPQFIQRRDGKAVVVVWRDYYERTKQSLKTVLLGEGYSGPGEAEFDRLMLEVRATTSAAFARRGK